MKGPGDLSPLHPIRNKHSRRRKRHMQQFFTEPNLGRYKELASGLLTPQERRITLEFLAAELAKQRCLEMAKGCGTG